MKLSLMFFASDGVLQGDDGVYGLLMKCARFADENGLHALWLPERHFSDLGAPFANPATVHAAVAATTSRIGLRAGSVVAPLHNVTRIAEEWSIVDNLSDGRVGVSLASGWNPDDFVVFPDRYEHRNDYIEETASTLRTLWSGHGVRMVNGRHKETEIKIRPRPVQPELPIWVTVARSPSSFERAGRMGANLLTHLLDQDVDTLADGLSIYHKALADAGFDRASRQVTVMMHTFISLRDTPEGTAARVRDAYATHLTQNLGLLSGLSASRGGVGAEAVRELTHQDRLELSYVLFDRFAAERSFIGTPDSCLPLSRKLIDHGVDEVACLVDFGAPAVDVLEGLHGIKRLDELLSENGDTAERGHAPTHQAEPDDPVTTWDAVREQVSEPIDPARVFDLARASGADYGTTMRTIEQVWLGDGEVCATLAAPEGDPMVGWDIHPVFVDNALLLTATILPGHGDSTPVALPVGMRSLRGTTRGMRRVHAHVRINEMPDGADSHVTGDARLFAEDGSPVAWLEGFRLRVMDEAADSPTEPSPVAGAARRPVDLRLITTDPARFHRLTDAVESAGGALRPHPDAESCLADLGEEQADVALDCTADDGDVSAAAMEITCRIAATVRALLQSGKPCRIWFLTRGAAPCEEAVATERGLAGAPVWGLARVLHGESPENWGGVVDLPPDDSFAWDDLVQVLGQDPHTRREDQVVLTSDGVRPVRLTAENLAYTDDHEQLDLSDVGQATVVVTGGTGAVGLTLTERLIESGATHIALVSRGSHDLPRDYLARWSTRAEVRVLTADVADDKAVRELPERIRALGWPDVGGVVHAAGVADGSLLRDMTADRIHTVLAPKALGAWHLHRTFPDAKLFCSISAIPALIGPIGSGGANYAAANVFLDALAWYRERRGLPSRVVNYGPWAEGGMAVREQGLAQLERFGVSGLTDAQAGAAFERTLGGAAVQTMATVVDWPRLLEAFPQVEHSGYYAGVLPDEQKARAVAAPSDGESVLAWIGEQIAGITGLDPDAVPHDVGLNHLGVDSLMGIEFRARARRRFGISIPMVELLRGPTVVELCSLVSSLADDEDTAEIVEVVL